MQLTEFLNGHTVEDVRRNRDGSVTLFCDSGRTVDLHVMDGRIVSLPPKIQLPDQPPPPKVFSERMRLLEAFQGFMIDHVIIHPDSGNLTFVCQPKKHDRIQYKKQTGHREIKLVHDGKIIGDLPPVSAIIRPESLSIFGKGRM